MGGATYVMPVIRGAFSQWAGTIDWTVRCDWLQVSSNLHSLQVVSFNFYRSRDEVFTDRVAYRQR